MIVSAGGAESDRASTSFGIREVTSQYMPNGARRFLINGRPILIRGGGWASDMLLRPVPQRVDDQLMYVRDMGLNAVRLEGKLESDHFFDEADTARDPRLARLDVLRRVAAIVGMDRRRAGDRPGVHDVASRSAAQPPERDHVHDRERHQAGRERAGDVREGPARRALAEPDPGVGVR